MSMYITTCRRMTRYLETKHSKQKGEMNTWGGWTVWMQDVPETLLMVALEAVNFLIQKTKRQFKKKKKTKTGEARLSWSQTVKPEIHQQRTINEVIKTLKDIFSFKKDLKRKECDTLQCIKHRRVKSCMAGKGGQGRGWETSWHRKAGVFKLRGHFFYIFISHGNNHMEQPHSQDTDSTFKNRPLCRPSHYLCLGSNVGLFLTRLDYEFLTRVF